jgi:predicted transposase YbfD/YdcC
MLQSFLFKVKDHRRCQGRRYQLGQILLFSVWAILGNATSYRQVHAFIKSHYATLDATFDLNWKRLPAYTTVRAIIQGTSATELEQSFREYSAFLASSDTAKRFVAFDGKVLRGSFDHFQDQKAIQVLSAFLADQRIILAHEEIARKTNEIPTAQALITALGLANCIFTFDAIHCQEKTLEVAKETGNDVIVQVKGNQKTLFADCQTLATTLVPEATYQEPTTKAHNRIERRSVAVFTHPQFRDADKWRLVAAVVQVERQRWSYDTQKDAWKPSHETSYYIATTILSAETFCQAIRNHWGIENRNHCVRDVTLGEDQSRIRTNPHIFAKLRSFALNILRANQVENVSLELFENCLNINNILNYVGIRQN